MTATESLRSAGLDDLWSQVRARLERTEGEGRGRVAIPAVGATGRLALTSLLGRAPGRTIDLGALEHALRALGVGDDLRHSLAALGHPVSADPQRRREERQAARAAREGARAAARAWPEPWAGAWIDDVIRAGGVRGLDEGAATRLVDDVRRLLDRLDGAGVGAPVSRVDLAAELFGSSHALDAGTRLEAAATRALAHRAESAAPRALWEAAGVHLDLTSAPVLTWQLPVSSDSGLAALVEAATTARVPLHLTQLALRQHPIAVAAGADVLVVENPRLVEAAAQMGVDQSVVATNGNPSTTVLLLLRQLLDCGAQLRYHGDFDAAGLAICARMHALGLTPWRMTAPDYRAAVEAARADGVELPTDASPAPATPWDPPLRDAFDACRAIVHEERLLPGLLET